MHSNKAPTSMLFQCVKLIKDSMNAIYLKPDAKESEWINLLQLMYYFRQGLACSICGKLASDSYTPVQEPCHCICANCRTNTQLLKQLKQNCVVCRNASEVPNGNGFILNSDLKYPAVMFEHLCKLLADKQLEHKFSNLQVSTQNGSITFGQLIQEGSCSNGIIDAQNLGDKFRKKAKEKEHHCRCGKGSKKNDLTCLGQRCACYQKNKGCVNCKCEGCKNPNGTPYSSSEIHTSRTSPHRLEDL